MAFREVGRDADKYISLKRANNGGNVEGMMVTYRPEMKRIRDSFGASTIEEYIRAHLLKEREPRPLSSGAYDAFQRNFVDEVRVVSTAGHLGLIEWDSPVLLGENVLTNLLYASAKMDKPIPIIPFSRIPFSNSTLPGSLALQGELKGGIQKYVFRGKGRTTVDRAAPITEEEVNRFVDYMHRAIEHQGSQREVHMRNLDIIEERLKAMLNAGNTFREQAEWLSAHLWQYLFSGKDLVAPIFKSIEALNLEDDNLLGNKKTRLLMEKLFAGVWGAYDGTYFYYGSCKCGREFPLNKEDDGDKTCLTGNCIKKDCEFYGNEKYRVDVDEIPSALRRGELHESLLMTYYKVWALAGIDVMGGFNQVEYLADFKQKLIKLFNDIGEPVKARILETRATDLFNTGIVVAFNADGSPKSGSQVVLEGGLPREHLESLSAMNFGVMLDASNYMMTSLIDSKKTDSDKFKQIIDLYNISAIVR